MWINLETLSESWDRGRDLQNREVDAKHIDNLKKSFAAQGVDRLNSSTRLRVSVTGEEWQLIVASMINAPGNELSKEHILTKTRISYVGNSDHLLKHIFNTATTIGIMGDQEAIRVVRPILKAGQHRRAAYLAYVSEGRAANRISDDDDDVSPDPYQSNRS
jgi:hypothetical protein